MENQELIQKTVRIPKDLYDKIQQEANKDNRDFSKQLNYTLKQYFEIKKNLQ
jgi:hypothetical protein